MNLMAPSSAREQLRKLISSFITGSVENIPNSVQELMTADVGSSSSVLVLRWIPFHMVYLLGEVREQCKLPDNVKDCLAAIVWAFDQFSTSKEESGDAWEAMFLAVLLVRFLSGIFEPKVLPLQNEVENDVLVAYNKPWKGASFNGEQDPLNFIRCIPKDNPAVAYKSINGHPAPAGSEGGTYVSIYYPGHARFKAYDIIVAVWKGKDRQLHGYQLKEDSSATNGFAHAEVFDASYLIRGDSKKESKSVRLYQAVSEDELETFFGISGNQWTPKRWKAIENAG